MFGRGVNEQNSFLSLAVPKPSQLLKNLKSNSKRVKDKLSFSSLFTGRVFLDINTVEWKGY